MVQWAPLAKHLRDDGRDRIELRHAEIEEILGAPLPASAVDHRQVFWSNSRTGGRSRHWLDVGYRTALRGMPRDAVAFVRDAGAGASRSAATRTIHRDVEANADVLLVGCVKTKAPDARPARDLYLSPLFEKRRDHAEASGVPWLVLSAEYGAVDPDEVIEPYDRYLEDQSAAYKHDWGQSVVEQLEALHGPLEGKVFELHASRAYGDPIEPLLRARGATLTRPLNGLLFGQHLQWYSDDLPPVAAPRRMSQPDSRRTRAPVGSMPHTAAADAGGLARRITRAFVDGELDLSGQPGAPQPGWDGMPEVVAADRVRSLGADDVGLRVFLTLVSAMDRARDADALWDRGAAAFETTHWVFDPRAVVRRDFTDLLDALRTTGLSQRHSSDVAAWRIICESLDDTTISPAIGRALIEGRGNAQELIAAVQARSEAASDRFPLLRGPKIRAMWIRILAHPGDAEISDLDALPVAVDVQVRKVTENLGVTDTLGQPLESVRDRIQQTWSQDVAEHGADGPEAIAGTPAALDPALWFYGKWGCTFCERAGVARPIHNICGGCRLMDGDANPLTTPG